MRWIYLLSDALRNNLELMTDYAFGRLLGGV